MVSFQSHSTGAFIHPPSTLFHMVPNRHGLEMVGWRWAWRTTKCFVLNKLCVIIGAVLNLPPHPHPGGLLTFDSTPPGGALAALLCLLRQPSSCQLCEDFFPPTFSTDWPEAWGGMEGHPELLPWLVCHRWGRTPVAHCRRWVALLRREKVRLITTPVVPHNWFDMKCFVALHAHL